MGYSLSYLDNLLMERIHATWLGNPPPTPPCLVPSWCHGEHPAFYYKQSAIRRNKHNRHNLTRKQRTLAGGSNADLKYSCSSTISTLERIDNKRRLQTLSIDNAWSNNNFLYYLMFRMPQPTSSEVNGYNCYKHLKNTKIKRGTGDNIKK